WSLDGEPHRNGRLPPPSRGGLIEAGRAEVGPPGPSPLPPPSRGGLIEACVCVCACAARTLPPPSRGGLIEASTCGTRPLAARASLPPPSRGGLIEATRVLLPRTRQRA